MVKVRNYLPRLVPGLRLRLLLLVVLACAPLVAVTLASSWQARRQAREEWSQRVEDLVKIAQREEEKRVAGTRQLLAAIAATSPVRNVNPRAAQPLMDNLLLANPRYANLGLISTNGEVLASAAPLTNGPPVRTRKFFRRAVEARRFAVGDVVDGTTNRSPPTVTFGLPVMHRDGRMMAVVFATLDLDWHSRFGTELPGQLPPGATWTEISPRGEVLFKYRGREAKPLQRFPSHLVSAVFASQQGLLEHTGADGIERITAYAVYRARVGDRRKAALLTLPKVTLFASADKALTRNLSLLALAAGLATAIGWFGSRVLVLRPVRAVVDSSTRLAQGDLSARIGLPYGRDELGALTRAFDRMAQALEQRELERNKANHKLQILSRRLVEVQESERRHIARELHDEIGQALTAADLNLRATIEAPGSTPLLPRLTASSEMIRCVLEKVQDMSLNLRPSMLDDLGLESAVRWYTTRQAELTGMSADFFADPLERRLDPVIETECFRVAQEALTNVARHAHARNIWVRLVRENGHLHLSVRDDGVGFDVPALRDQAVRGASLGLLSMEERAALAGGGLEFSSAPGAGTEVRAWFPLRWRDSATN